MKRVGEVVRTAQGLAILRSADDEIPDLGREVLDERLDPVGRVVDVFGPTDRPYVAVSPEDGDGLAALLGEKLYTR